MKIYRIQLTAEEQKKLEQLLKRRKLHDAQSLFEFMLRDQWLRMR